MAAWRVVYTVKVWSSGGASYGAKELTPLQFLLQPLQNFCVKQYNVSRSMFVRTKIQIAATGCHILRLKCTKIDFFWGQAPDPVVGAYSAPPDPMAGFKGSYF